MDLELGRTRDGRFSIQERAAAGTPQFDDSDGADDEQQDTSRNDFDEDMVEDDDNGDDDGNNETDVDDGDADAVEDEIGDKRVERSQRIELADESCGVDEFDASGYLSLPYSLRPTEMSNSRQSLRPLPHPLVGNDPANAPLPPHLKDISSLAAWTVSTHKPGCGVAALRDPSPNLFWQSDGPQPHHLNIHFFKLVSIAHIRVYLDYEQDESYTPTKLHFLAGTGHHDLQDFCTMTFSQPKGWLDVDLSNAGGPVAFEDGELDDDAIAEEAKSQKAKKKKKLPGYGPTLRCRLVQLRILENHQNGKDTHLRGLQIFAVDESAVRTRRRQRSSVKAAPQAIDNSPSKSMGGSRLSNVAEPGLFGVPSDPESTSRPSDTIFDLQESATKPRRNRLSKQKPRVHTSLLGLRESDWMGEPVLR